MSARTAGGTPATEGRHGVLPLRASDGPRQQHLLLDLMDRQLDEVLADFAAQRPGTHDESLLSNLSTAPTNL